MLTLELDRDTALVPEATEDDVATGITEADEEVAMPDEPRGPATGGTTIEAVPALS